MSKKPYLIVFLIFLMSNICIAQKLYVWCPDETVIKPRIGFLKDQEINLVVFDGRVIPEKSKVECDGKSVIQALITTIYKAYPSCKINILADSQYYAKSEKGKITIKIAIAAYKAGFGVDVTVGIGNIGGKFSYGVIPKGEWNGLVSYYVQVFDNRTEDEKKYQDQVSQITSKSNMWGYKTAKSCLNTSFEKANQDLLFFIDNTFLE